MLVSEANTKINKAMVSLVPELDTEVARYPLSQDRWLAPHESYETNREPCFIKASENGGIWKNYIYCAQKRGSKPAGYYHLRTREGHEEAYLRFRRANRRRRLRSITAFVGHLGRKSRRHVGRKKETMAAVPIDAEMYRKARRILQNRVLYEPDDIESARMRLLNVQFVGSNAKAAGKAAYLPTLSGAVLVGASC